MPSATTSAPARPNTSSPRDTLLGFQIRRENRALLDALENQKFDLEEQKAQAIALAESQRLREEELARKIQEAQDQTKQIKAEMEEMLKEMSEQIREHDDEIRGGVAESVREIERSVVAQLSARLPLGALASAMANAQDEDGTQPASSPPAHPRAQLRPAASAQPQPASPAFAAPQQRYALRGAARAAAAASPSSSANAKTSANTDRKENVDARANLSRKRSMGGTDTPATPALTRARSSSSSSTLSTAPSSQADGEVAADADIPALPFNHRGSPHQGDLGVEIYFAAAKTFARERGVNRESADAQATFIIQIFKGMKKEERSEIVAALEEWSLAKTDTVKRTVQFFGSWDEIAEAVDRDVLMEAKAKANLMRATAALMG